eukprot:scaffold2.g7394.t1
MSRTLVPPAAWCFLLLLVNATAHIQRDSQILSAASADGSQSLGRAGRRWHTTRAEEDRVKSLPGWGTLDNLALFSGYVTLNEQTGKSFFYAFVEALEEADAKPLLLWLNGGPGCSSIGGGLFSEIGPLFPTLEGRLAHNAFTWARSANLLFVDSPAFTGWSYSNDSADLRMGDVSLALDHTEFLLRWVRRFPSYRNRELWLAGESFSGHYIPHLAAQMLRLDSGQRLNLQGFLLGNPLTDGEVDNRASVEYWWAHGMISREAKEGLDANCDYATFVSPATRREGLPASLRPAVPRTAARSLAGTTDKKRQQLCTEFTNMAEADMAGINEYDVHEDVCQLTAPPGDESPQPARARGATPGGFGQEHSGGDGCATCDPCIGLAVEAYLNQPEVQAALHANVSGMLSYRWTLCTSRVQYDEHDLYASMLPLWRETLLGSGLRLLVYSGDLDSILPTAGTRKWVEGLKLPVERPWRMWRSATGQVGGWTVDYRGVSYATVAPWAPARVSRRRCSMGVGGVAQTFGALPYDIPGRLGAGFAFYLLDALLFAAFSLLFIARRGCAGLAAVGSARRRQHSHGSDDGGLDLPGGVVAAVTPPGQAYHIVLVSGVLWGATVPLALMLMTLYLQRLLIHHLPPAEVIISSFLPGKPNENVSVGTCDYAWPSACSDTCPGVPAVAPYGMAGYALLTLSKAARSAFEPGLAAALSTGGAWVALALWGSGIFWLWLALVAVGSRLRWMNFNIGWWAFVFPSAVLTGSTGELAQRFDSQGFRVLTAVLSVATLVLFSIAAAGSLWTCCSRAWRWFSAACTGAEAEDKANGLVARQQEPSAEPSIEVLDGPEANGGEGGQLRRRSLLGPGFVASQQRDCDASCELLERASLQHSNALGLAEL